MAGKRRFFVVDGAKVCTRCHQTKPVSEFHNRRAGTKVRAECKDCARHVNRLHKYGVDEATYDRLLAAQEGKCAICRTSESGVWRGNESWYVDHNHEDGTVRGLLCINCNLLLGYAKDDRTILASASLYLRDRGAARKAV